MNWRARISAKRLFVAAVSARPFVRAAAAAGYQVVAADAFCDADTRRHAAAALQLHYRDGGFAAMDIERQLLPLLTSEDVFVFGSGFETQPQLLESIAGRCRLLGNTAETVRATKDPDRFFLLLSRLNIPFPEVSLAEPAAPDGWLRKRVGGSGGVHVTSVHVTFVPATAGVRYWQREAPGSPYSLLFLANGTDAVAVGYNEQWVAPAADAPYRYGGAVSQADLPESVRQGMLDAARRITAELGLRGLNSLDCMVAGEIFRVLEINPRLSATFALYDAMSSGARLFEAHLRGCMGGPLAVFPPEPAQAHLIYYAPFDMTLPLGMVWPAWVADIPDGAMQVHAGEPLCSLMATAATAAAARLLVEARAEALTQQIIQLLG